MATRLGRDKGVTWWAAAAQQYQAGSNKQYLDWKCWIPNNDAAQLFNTSDAIKPAGRLGNGNACLWILSLHVQVSGVHQDARLNKVQAKYNQRWWPELPLKNCSIYTYVWKLKWIFLRAIFCVKYSMKYSLGLEIFCLEYSLYKRLVEDCYSDYNWLCPVKVRDWVVLMVLTGDPPDKGPDDTSSLSRTCSEILVYTWPCGCWDETQIIEIFLSNARMI